MTTYNLLVNTDTWTKLVAATDTDFLVTWTAAKIVEFASTDADTTPVVNGHRMHRDQRVTREDVGAGYVWAKLVPSGVGTSILLSVSKTASIAGAIGGFDSIEGVHKVANMVWNATYLQWERSTGASSGGGTTSVVPTTKRFDKRNATELYVGNAEVGVSEGTPNWAIQKVMFDTNGNALASYYGVGSWVDRYSVTYQ